MASLRCGSMGRWPRLAPADMDCPIVDSSSFFHNHNLPQPTYPTQSCLAQGRRMHSRYQEASQATFAETFEKYFPERKKCSRSEGESFAVDSDRSPRPGIVSLAPPPPRKNCNTANTIQIHHKQSADTTQWVTQIQKYNTGTV